MTEHEMAFGGVPDVRRVGAFARWGRRLVGLGLPAAIAIGAAGCATATTTGTFPAASLYPSVAHVFVMLPTIEGSSGYGNTARNLSEVRRAVTARLLAIVQERDPEAAVAEATGKTPYLPMKRYIDAVAPSRTTLEELSAAGFAREHGGTHLLVPAIVEWREMRTDDPIGALIPPHDGIAVSLRLVRLEPPAVEGQVTFANHSRVTVNQPAERLLNDDFRRTVLRLVRGHVG